MPTPTPKRRSKFLFTPARAVASTHRELDRRVGGNGVKFGVDVIDRDFVPLQNGEGLIILGRPSRGKTSVLMHLGRLEARKCAPNEAILFATWEETVEELVAALSAATTGKTVADIGRGLDPAELQRVKDGSVAFIKERFYIVGRDRDSDPDYSHTVADIEMALDELKEAGIKVRLLLVDYLQSIEGEVEHRDKVQFVSTTLYRLLRLGMAYGVPTVIAAQAGREVDTYGGMRFPKMGDGQWTSNIEQRPAKIMVIARPIFEFPLGTKLDLAAGGQVVVTPELFCLKLVKQRFGSVDPNRVYFCDFDFATATLAPRGVVGEIKNGGGASSAPAGNGRAVI